MYNISAQSPFRRVSIECAGTRTKAQLHRPLKWSCLDISPLHNPIICLSANAGAGSDTSGASLHLISSFHALGLYASLLQEEFLVAVCSLADALGPEVPTSLNED
jgi:hypothetical protein